MNIAYIPSKNFISTNRMAKVSSIKIGYEMIFKVVNDQFETSTEMLTGKSQKRSIVYPRQISMYLMAFHTFLSFKDIGDLFGKDHSTVSHSIEVIEDLMDSDDSVRQQINLLTVKIFPYGTSGEEDIRGGA